MLKSFLFVVVFTISAFSFTSAQNVSDSLKQFQTDSIIVTATRTEIKAEDSPIPVYLIDKEEIKNSGSSKLDDILKEQTGINITNFLYSGVQMQGLDPAYSLILINGEPLVGRNGGTIDLSRINLSNVKQIEIVKGPSSSLYGSEALSGVINIITETTKKKFGSSINLKYGTFNTSEVNADIDYIKGRFSLYTFVDFNHSNGYSVIQGSSTRTGADYDNFTLSPTLKYWFTDNISLELNSRLFKEKTFDIARLVNGDNNYEERTTLQDYNNSLILNLRVNGKLKLQTKLYNTFYEYDNKITEQVSGNLNSEDNFQQTYTKAEILFEGDYVKNNKYILGVGIGLDKVKADRIYEGSKSANNKFVYFQNEFTPFNSLNITAGIRYDDNSDYSSKLSPKFSFLYRPFNYLRIRSSYGTGFKAPSFQQLYLDFTNPQVGYSVFGTAGFLSSLQKLIDNGEISKLLIDPATIGKIRPENSKAFNFDLTFNPSSKLSGEVNFFRNDIQDMIEVLPAASKTNGQQVFTYFNLNRIYTQGLEANAGFEPAKGLHINIGYQYLEAKDKDVITAIENGSIFKIGSTGIVRPVQLSEYGGLLNRSKQSGVVKISYDLKRYNTIFTLRTILKGRYGFADRNGNGILDEDNEYAPGYLLWNSSITHKIFPEASVLLGIDNIFDHTNPEFSPELPGRIIYISLNYRFK
ncbi:TonB-dependent receptor [soil metagenome]